MRLERGMITVGDIHTASGINSQDDGSISIRNLVMKVNQHPIVTKIDTLDQTLTE